MFILSHTPNKQNLRRKWDKPIIESFVTRIDRQMNYFGLPGPDIQDLIDWREYLDFITAVEYYTPGKKAQKQNQEEKINTLQFNVMRSKIRNFELRKGKLEDIIIKGYDVDNIPPRLLQLHKNMHPQLKYDLHNWDFQGGLYKDKEGVGERIEAIKKCIRLQKGHEFLFLLTLNVRHSLGDELQQYIKGTARDSSSSVDEINDFNWFANCGSHNGTERYKVKTVVPLFIRQAAQLHSFNCFSYPPIYYEGYKEHLIHFVFHLIPKRVALPVFSDQSQLDIITTPLIELRENDFCIPDLQHPSFNTNDWLKAISSSQLPISYLLERADKK